MWNLLPSSRKEEVLLGATIGTVAWILVVGLYVANLLEPYEIKTYDHLCRLNAKQSPAPEGGPEREYLNPCLFGN